LLSCPFFHSIYTDYLVMESILNLFARMIPPSGSTVAGRATRRAFIQSVFVESSPDDVKTGEKLADMVEHVSTPEWDQTASRIVEVLAASNIGLCVYFITYLTIDPDIYVLQSAAVQDY
jgi:hypothetical protein